MNESVKKLTDEIFSKEIILKQTDKILLFSAFSVSEILRNFLVYIINETLSGRERDIKEYTIAVYVLKKRFDFQPLRNGVVRVHARRLRDALNDYYLSDGVEDDCEITIPKGGYKPVFRNRNSRRFNANAGKKMNSRVEPNKRTTVAVMPFRTFGKLSSRLALAARVSQLLSNELSENSTLSVLSPSTTKQLFVSNKKTIEVMTDYGVQYLLSGYVHFESGKIMVLTELIDNRTKILLWTYKCILKIEKQGLFEAGEKVVLSIVNNLNKCCCIFEKHSFQKLSIVSNEKSIALEGKPLEARQIKNFYGYKSYLQLH